ncbi:MAG: hypothetical protein V3W34_13100 [Phycisphaerae bacterium]
MPAPQRNQWAEMWEAARERTSTASHQLRQWGVAVREEPVLIWQTPAVRYGLYALGGLVLFLVLKTAMGMLQLPTPEHFQPRAKTAHFQVLCSNPACGKYFVIERRFKFRKFPVTCPYCREPSGHRALRCTSKTCRGGMVIAVEEDGRLYCSKCGEPIGNR